MRSQRFVLWVALILPLVASSSCATSVTRPTLTLEQHTLRIPLTVGSDGTVSFSERPPLIGRIDLSPILEAEGLRIAAARKTAVQVIVHYGRIYVAGDSLRSVWEITPLPGTSTATYRPIPAGRKTARAAMRDVRLSRYGSSRSSCLRIDGLGREPLFITSAGEVRNDCP